MSVSRRERHARAAAADGPQLSLVGPDRQGSHTPVPTGEPSGPPGPWHEVVLWRERTEALEATQRLVELFDVEPATRPRRSTRLLGLAFAASAWATLGLVLAGLEPSRL